MPKRLTPTGQAAPPVEPIVTGATLPVKPSPKKAVKRPRTTDTGVRYVRNLHHIKTIVRLTSKREIILEPRGQREDLDVVSAEEQEDPKFLANRDLIFELISVDAAKEIIAKQQTNATTQTHSLWDHLRNQDGKAYEQRVAKIEEAFEKQGVVVGQVQPDADTRNTSHNVRVERVGPEQVSVPGSAGHPATEFMHSVPSDVPPDEYHEFLLWKQFKLEQARLAQAKSDA